MKVWIFILKAFGYVWLTAAVLLILAGIVGTWLKGGFSAVQELLSPFNVINWIVSLLLPLPQGSVPSLGLRNLMQRKPFRYEIHFHILRYSSLRLWQWRFTSVPTIRR